jgi:hypothetical protein
MVMPLLQLSCPPVGETNPSLKNIVAIKQNKSTTKNDTLLLCAQAQLQELREREQKCKVINCLCHYIECMLSEVKSLLARL